VKYLPHPYQRTGERFLLEHGAGGLFWAPGLGKSSCVLSTFKTLKAAGIVKKMLVVAPLGVAYSAWPGELAKWDEFSGLRLAVLHKKGKAALYDPHIDIHVINFEGLGWLTEATVGKPWPWEMLVCDESTGLKNPSTLRFKTLKKLLNNFKRRYILTGSPVPNGLLDLFGQVYILDGGNALGKWITHYRLEHFDNPDRNGWQWVLKPGHEKIIYEKLAPLVLRMSAEDYLDLPPVVENTVYVDLPPKAMKTYKQMEKVLIAEVASGTIVAANAAAATNKCRQIANGGIYHEGGEKWSQVHDAKTEAVKALVAEMQGRPALIAYEFQHDLARLQAAFPGVPHLGGGVTPRRQTQIEAEWNRGDLPVLLVQPQSVAHGRNLQEGGAAIIWNSLTWNLELKEQLDARLHRQGQKERVVVHSIVARGTIDEVVMKMVAKKDKTQQALLAALRDYAKEVK
jgi:SNF2 family DNA or RNA helicase